MAPPEAVLRGGLSPWPIDADDPLRPPRAWLEDLARETADAQPVLLCGGDPARELAAWAADGHLEVMVVAAHDGRVARTVLGSVARTLAAGAPCDVLVAHLGDGGAERAVRHVACCIDGSPGSRRALDTARTWAGRAGAPLSLVHVVAPPRPLPRELVARALPPPERRSEEAEAMLEEAGLPSDGGDRIVLTGAPGPAVRRWAASAGVDLLVTGPREHAAHGLGGFTASLAGDAPAPVLFARR